MENILETIPLQYKFEHHGPFAACPYKSMESVLAEYGHGKWKIATTAETLQFSPIRTDAYHWTSTRNFWTKDGIIIYDDPERKMPSDAESLLKLHKEGNPSVRFVEYGFKTGKHTIEDFVKNPFVIAQVGNKDLMDIVAKRAKQMDPESSSAYVIMMNFSQGSFSKGLNENVVRPTVIDSWGTCGQALHIYGDITEENNGSIMGHMTRIRD